MKFADKLKKLRAESNMTQEELAEKVCVSRVAVSKWETGRGFPNIDSLQLLAKTFCVSVDELLSATDILDITEKERSKSNGLFNVLSLLLLVLPIFRSANSDGSFSSMLIFNIARNSLFTAILQFSAIFISITCGLLALCSNRITLKFKTIICKAADCLMLLVFILTMQPYPAIFALAILIRN